MGPADLFEVDDAGKPVYEDAVALDGTWDELAELAWDPPRLREAKITPERRQAALRRRAEQWKRQGAADGGPPRVESVEVV